MDETLATGTVKNDAEILLRRDEDGVAFLSRTLDADAGVPVPCLWYCMRDGEQGFEVGGVKLDDKITLGGKVMPVSVFSPNRRFCNTRNQSASMTRVM